MDTVLQTNVFFFITSVATIVLSVLVGIALFYFIGILRNVRDVTDRMRRGTETLAEDLSDLRDNIKEEGVRIKHFVQFIGRQTGWFSDRGKRPRRRSRRKSEIDTSSEEV